MTRKRKPSQTRSAIRDSILAQMAGTLPMVLFQHGGLASLLIIALIGDNSEFEIGCAFCVMQWGMLMRLLAAPHVDTSHRRRFLVGWSWVSTAVSVLFLLVPAIGLAGMPRPAAWFFVATLAAYFFSLHIGGAAWFPLLSHILPSTLRGRYFGNMRRAWQITGFGAVLLSGVIMRGTPGLSRFYLVLVPAVAFQFVRVILYARLPDPPPAKPKSEGTFWTDLLRPLRDAQFRVFLVAIMGIAIVQHAAVPFVVPYMKTELGFPASVTLYGTACVGVGSVLSLVAWGRLVDRWGNRLGFVLSILINVFACFIFASAPAYDRAGAWAFGYAAVGLLLAGVGTAGAGIAYTVRLMFLAPTEHAGPYMNAGQSMIGAAGGVVALLTGLVLSRAPDKIVMRSLEIGTFRCFFIVVGIVMAFLTLFIRRLPPIAEPRLRHIVSRVLNNLSDKSKTGQ